jgi:hypothetical protein
MIYSYCKRCRMESPGDVCSGCGRRAAAALLRDKWSVDSIPLRDGRAWRTSICALLGASALMLAAVFGLEAVFGGPARLTLLWRSALIRVTLAFAVIGLSVVFLFLLLQGREANVFTLDASGAHQHTLHGSQKWKSWARLQSADPGKDIPQQDGTVLHLSQERHMLWKDVISVRYRPERGVILLYHTPRLAPMELRLPAEEYEMAESFVKKYCKGK